MGGLRVLGYPAARNGYPAGENIFAINSSLPTTSAGLTRHRIHPDVKVSDFQMTIGSHSDSSATLRRPQWLRH